MIGACATEAGLESYKNEDIVFVKYDDTAQLAYQYGGEDSYRLQVMVDDKKVAPTDLEKKHAVVKAKGDEIYGCAQTRLHPQPNQVVVAPAQQGPAQPSTGMSFNVNANESGMSMSMNASAPSNAPAPSASASVGVATGGTCAQALDCYAQLGKLLCDQGASECSFKAEISGNDESGCRDALLRVPDIIQTYSMVRPGLSAPSVCRVR